VFLTQMVKGGRGVILTTDFI